MPSKFPDYLDPATLRWVADGMARNAELAKQRIADLEKQEEIEQQDFFSEICMAVGVRDCSRQAATWIRSAATRIENRQGSDDAKGN